MRRCLPPSGLSVGLFLSKDPVEAQIVRCLRVLLADSRVCRIMLRPHPVNLWSALETTVAAFADPRLVPRSSGSLVDDLHGCDLVFGGNSTVLLDAVVSGRPACYVRGFDHGPYDVQDFVHDGLVYEWMPQAPVDLADIDRFYGRPAWPAILRRFADIDHAEDEVASAVVAAVNRLAPRGHTAGAAV
jgi:hypothetical protein